jgi:hypothetical protein
MMACRGGDSRLLRSPLGGHAGERDAGAVDQRGPAHQGFGRKRLWREARRNSVLRALRGAFI